MANKVSQKIKQATQLISGNAVGQFVALLLLAIVGRQYSEETMGMLGSFMAWAGIFAIAATGRYEYALVVAPNPSESKTLLKLAIRLAGFSSAILLATLLPITIIWGHYIPLGNFLLLVPLYVALFSIYNCLVMWLLHHRKYKQLALSQAIKGVSNNLLKVLFGFVSASVLSLVLSQFFAFIIPLLFFGIFALRLFKMEEGEVISYKTVAKQYQTFPKYGIPDSLIGTLMGTLIVIALPLRYTMAEVGYLTMASMLARRPLNLVSESISQVYFQHFSLSHNKGEAISPEVKHFIIWCYVLGIPLCILLWWAMPWLVTIFVGEKWLPAASIIRAMLPALIPSFATAVLNVIPDILQKQRINMWANVVILIIYLLAIVIGFELFDWDNFILFFYGANFVTSNGYLYFLYRMSKWQ